MSYIIPICIVILTILNGLNLVIHIVAILKAISIHRKRCRARKNIITYNGHEDLETWPRVSIIKPIVVDEPKIKSLIEAYFQLDYPSYDIHFCFQSTNHSCIQYVNQLSTEYPRVKVFIHTEPPVQGYGNKKILNAKRAYKYLRGELVWIVDENIHAHIMSLKEMVSQFDSDDVACVHQIPMWKCRDTLEHTINSTYFSTHHSRFYLFSEAVNIICVSGMSMMFDKEKLDEVGGIASFDKFLSEDYAESIALAHRGYRVKVAPSPAVQDPSNSDIKGYIDRMIRWSKLRLNIFFIITILEPFIHPLLFSIISAFLIFMIFSYNFIPIFIIYIIGTFFIDQLQTSILAKAFPEHGPLPSWKFTIYSYILLQFFLQPYIYVSSVWNFKTIKWHDCIYNLSWGTVIIPTNNSTSKKNSILLKRFKRFKELQNELL